MNRRSFSRTLSILTVVLACTMLFACMGCDNSSPTGPKNDSKPGNGGNGGNGGGGGGGGGGANNAALTVWTASNDFDGLRIYIDNDLAGTLSPIGSAPECGQRRTGVVSIELEPGTHEVYIALGDQQSDPEEFEVEGGTCYLAELGAPEINQPLPDLNPRPVAQY